MPIRTAPPSPSIRSGTLGGSRGPSRAEVGTLRIAVPGPDAAFGRRVGERAAAILAQRLPPGLAGDIARLEVKVHPRDLSEAGLTDGIAQAVLAALGRI